MTGRKRLIGLIFLAFVTIAGAQALMSNPAPVEETPAGLRAMVARYCLEGEEGRSGGGVTDEWCGMDVREILLHDPGRESVALEVLVAADSRERAAGYQGIEAQLVRETATLFLFPRPLFGGFHMCNVEAPLWIVWYLEDGTPLDAQLMLPGERAPASRCADVYIPRRAGLYRYALEIGEELAREHGLGERELVSMRLGLAPWMGQGR